MSIRVLRNEAELRCRNAEPRRIRLFKAIDRDFESGKLTSNERIQMISAFWRSLAQDKRIANGEEEPDESGSAFRSHVFRRFIRTSPMSNPAEPTRRAVSGEAKQKTLDPKGGLSMVPK